MPAASSSSTSCQRLAWRLPGTLLCASSSTSASGRLAGEQPVEVHFDKRASAIGQPGRRQDLEPADQPLGLGATMRLHDADHARRRRRPCAAGRPPASHRSCRRRARRRERSSAARAPPSRLRRGAHPVAGGLPFPWSAIGVRQGKALVKRQVEQQDIDARLAQQAETRGLACARRPGRVSPPGRRRVPLRRAAPGTRRLPARCRDRGRCRRR